MNTLMIYPMFALVILTYIVLILAFKARSSAIKEKQLTLRYFRTFEGAVPTELMVKTGRHVSNLFEVPVLFYAGCLTAMIINIQSVLIVVLAWLFVVARCLHAFIHIGSNKVLYRLGAYVLGLAAVLALWIHIIISF